MPLKHVCGHRTKLTSEIAKMHKLTSDKIELADDDTFYLTFKCDECLGLEEDEYLIPYRLNALLERTDRMNEKAAEMLKKAVVIGKGMLEEMVGEEGYVGETKSEVHETFAAYEKMAKEMIAAVKQEEEGEKKQENKNVK
jgi:hypothetical protein